MSDSASYREKLDNERILLIRDQLSALPRVCGDFIRAIGSTTTTLTRFAYTQDLKLFFYYLQTENAAFAKLSCDDWTQADFDRIGASDIERYYDFLTYYVKEDDSEYKNGDLSKNRKGASLRSFFNYMYKTGKVTRDVSALVDIPKRHEKPILRLEINEMARLLDVAETGEALSERQMRYHEITKLRDLTMLTLFLGTGIRVSECVGLNVDDLDLDNAAFLLTRKGGNQTILYLPAEVVEQLRTYLTWRADQKAMPGHEAALFLSLQNKRMGVRAVENMVKKYGVIAAPLKKRISPHKLRATFGTNLYNETGDIYLVADVLGHADVNTTRKHYAAMLDKRRRMAANSVVLHPPAAPPDEADET